MTPSLPDVSGVRHDDLDLATGVRVHVAQAGPDDAPPVLCLHGWPQHWFMWRRVIPLLAGDFRLICPDVRGFGWSGWPADGDFRKDRLAEDAVAVLDALQVERAHVLGHDWGAWTALLLAIDHPERLHGALALSVLHPWQERATALRNAWRFAYQVPIATPLLGERLQRTEGFIRRVLKSGWGDRATWDEEAGRCFEEAMRTPQAARAGHRMYRSFLTQEMAPSLGGRFTGRRLGVPTRLVIGDADPLGAGLVRGIERRGDDARYEVLQGCGHFMPEERPEAVAERVRDFI